VQDLRVAKKKTFFDGKLAFATVYTTKEIEVEFERPAEQDLLYLQVLLETRFRDLNVTLTIVEDQISETESRSILDWQDPEEIPGNSYPDCAIFWFH